MTAGQAVFTSESLQFSLRYAAGTDIGRKREENQDSFAVLETEQFSLYMVADGMGGAKGGAVASGLAVSLVKHFIRSRGELTVETLVEGVKLANEEIFSRGEKDPSLHGMGTTFVGFGFSPSGLLICNVGDSRGYRIREGNIELLTRDHTLVQELLRAGSITEEQAETHPISHYLTRSLGPAAKVDVDCAISSDPPLMGDRYLLCSDGLYNLISPRELASIITRGSLDDAVQECIDTANLRGGNDNISIVVIEVVPPYGSSQGMHQDDQVLDDSINEFSHRATLGGAGTLQETYLQQEIVRAVQECIAVSKQQAASIPPKPSPPENRPSRNRAYWVLGMLCAVFTGGAIGALVPSRLDKQKRTEVSSALPVDSADRLLPAVQERVRLPTLAVVEPTPDLQRYRDDIVQQIALKEEEIESLHEQMAILRESSVKKLDDLVLKMTKELKEKELALDQNEEELKSEITQGAVWYDRQRKIQDPEILQLGSFIQEMEDLSPEISEIRKQQKIAVYELTLAINQKDSSHAATAKRKRELDKQLELTIRKVIDENVKERQNRATELNNQKRKFEEEIRELKSKLEFVEKVRTASPLDKVELEASLTQNKNEKEKQLQTLNFILQKPGE